MSVFSCTYTRLSVILVCLLFVAFYIFYYQPWPSWYYNTSLPKHSTKYETSSPNLRILCFGDSLTAGVMKRDDLNDSNFHPYSKTLRKLFDKDLAKKRSNIQGKSSIKIKTAGVPGERVDGSMKQRLYGLLNRNITYDWVVILGGTNDLGFLVKKPDIAPNITSILEALLGLHDLSHAFLARTIAVSIPPRRCRRNPKCKPYRDARYYINKELRMYSTKRKGKTLYVDIETEMNTDKYWSDEVHFTDSGYDRIANILFKTLHKNI